MKLKFFFFIFRKKKFFFIVAKCNHQKLQMKYKNYPKFSLQKRILLERDLMGKFIVIQLKTLPLQSNALKKRKKLEKKIIIFSNYNNY